MSSWKNNHVPAGFASGAGAGYNNGNNNNMMSYPPQQQDHNQMQQQQHYQQPSNNTTIETTGPRAKCDQVVYEAIAKAAEIVVGSRCYIDSNSGGFNAGGYRNQDFSKADASNPSTTASRFNLFVPEVQGVRSILQRWKRALHVPLRLDVYYQHPDGQRQLLERWCLEYAPSIANEGNSTSVSTFHPNAANTNNAFVSPDPIVQLRQVCKNIVIWLRTLYCWSRMLPAQALRKMTHPNHVNSTSTQSSPIGFCIYVVSEGQDDVSGLVSQEGFSTQSQPHSVPTPYGELGWKVFYAPKSVVKQLLPEPTSPYYGTLNNGINSNNATKTQPIPMNGQQQQQLQQQSPQTPPPMTTLKTARSAPQHGGHFNLYRRANSDFSSKLHPSYTTEDGDSMNGYHRSDSVASPNATAVAAPRSYHNRHHYMQQAHKAQSSGDMDEHLWLEHQQQQQPQAQQGFAYPETTTQPLKDDTAESRGLSSKTKNLSGLSLALMMSDEQSLSLNSADVDSVGEKSTNTDADSNWNQKPAATETPASAEETAAAEKRRAALHSAPPQFTTNSPAAVAASPLKAATTTAGEYGYAYNNHIPTLQHQHPNAGGGGTSSNPSTPNTNNTSTAALGAQAPQFPTASSYNTTSPLLRPMTPLGSTPPTYLLSATPSTSAGMMMAGPVTPSSVGSGGLIPPRNAVTPPFVRPMGFVGEAPSQPMPPPTDGVPAANGQEGHKNNGAAAAVMDHDTSLQQHQTSLDLLHSSPFQYPPSHTYYSMHTSSLQQNGGDHESSTAAAFMSDYYHRSGHLTEDIVQGRGRSNSDAFFENDLSDDMPFAVDPIASSSSGAAGSGGVGNANTNNATGASPTAGLASMMNEASLVASMCTAAPKRLAMFDSKLQEGSNGSAGEQQTPQEDSMANVMDSLADQLEDFKSFGASLSVANAAIGAAGSSFAPEAPTASAGSG